MSAQEEDRPPPGRVDGMLCLGPIVCKPDTLESWAGLSYPDGKLFTVVISKWELTPGQVVFGALMREGRPGPNHSGRLGPEEGGCRFYFTICYGTSGSISPGYSLTPS